MCCRKFEIITKNFCKIVDIQIFLVSIPNERISQFVTLELQFNGVSVRQGCLMEVGGLKGSKWTVSEFERSKGVKVGGLGN